MPTPLEAFILMVLAWQVKSDYKTSAGSNGGPQRALLIATIRHILRCRYKDSIFGPNLMNAHRLCGAWDCSISQLLRIIALLARPSMHSRHHVRKMTNTSHNDTYTTYLQHKLKCELILHWGSDQNWTSVRSGASRVGYSTHQFPNATFGWSDGFQFGGQS